MNRYIKQQKSLQGDASAAVAARCRGAVRVPDALTSTSSPPPGGPVAHLGRPRRPSPEEITIMQNPSVGRIVHYHDGTAADPQAAIIIAVHDNVTSAKRWPNVDGYHLVSLTVFAADRPVPYSVEPVPYSEDAKAGHWAYPPRV